ncbi:uncharacterized protein [Rhodnius prolixus]|uniref:uncharacterized protein n=1 Tax=Rhodnius prolixus TaxID=13249 RepID=UPI003D18AF95
MNFIKLLPILFLGLPGSGKCRPVEQQLLPAIPGYVPVYIQTGNVPPDVEALYHARKVVERDQATSASENKEVHAESPNINEKPKEEPKEEKEEVVTKQPVEEHTKDGENKRKYPTKSPDEQSKPEDEKTGDVHNPEELPLAQEKSEKVFSKGVSRSVGHIKEIPQYQVKEPQNE